jgi:hypothetical protein
MQGIDVHFTGMHDMDMHDVGAQSMGVHIIGMYFLGTAFSCLEWSIKHRFFQQFKLIFVAKKKHEFCS